MSGTGRSFAVVGSPLPHRTEILDRLEPHLLPQVPMT